MCEGSKTEPNYLTEFIRHHQLSSANIQIIGDGGSAPNSVVSYAIELFDKDSDYDVVFCVFDRDGHTTFEQAVQRIRNKQLVRRQDRRMAGRARFEAIHSIPCFEYWVLLHFEYTTTHMARFADVDPRLRTHAAMSNYAKGRLDLYAQTRDRLQTAFSKC